MAYGNNTGLDFSNIADSIVNRLGLLDNTQGGAAIAQRVKTQHFGTALDPNWTTIKQQILSGNPTEIPEEYVDVAKKQGLVIRQDSTVKTANGETLNFGDYDRDLFNRSQNTVAQTDSAGVPVANQPSTAVDLSTTTPGSAVTTDATGLPVASNMVTSESIAAQNQQGGFSYGGSDGLGFASIKGNTGDVDVNDSEKQKEQTPAYTGVDVANSAFAGLQALSSLADSFYAKKVYDLGVRTQDFNEKVTNRNLDNQAKLITADQAGVAANRRAAGSGVSVNRYLDKYGVRGAV